MATKKHTGGVAQTDLAIKREQNSNALKVKQERDRAALETKLEKSGLHKSDAGYQQAIYHARRVSMSVIWTRRKKGNHREHQTKSNDKYPVILALSDASG